MLPNLLDIVRSNLAYGFLVVGVIWAAIAGVLGFGFLLWPAVTCLAAGVLLKVWSSGRITWPWSVSAAALGFFVSGYQVCVAIPLVIGVFSTVAFETLVIFTIFALVHLVLLYTGYTPASEKDT